MAKTRTIPVTKTQAVMLWMALVEMPEVKGREFFRSWMKARDGVEGILPALPAIVQGEDGKGRYSYAQSILGDPEPSQLTLDESAFGILNSSWETINRTRFLLNKEQCTVVEALDTVMADAKAD